MPKINKIMLLAVFFMCSLLIAQPTQVFPPNGFIIYDATPWFDWTDESGAIEYRLQIDETNDFGSPIIDKVVPISEDSIPDFQSLPESLYYWRVRVENPLGDWSDIWTVRVQLKGPDLLLPEPDAVINDPTPTFIWYLLGGAANFRITITPEGSAIPIVDSTFMDTVFTCPITLTENLYYWDVQAYDSIGNPSAISTRSFIIDITPPNIPSLSSPPDDTVFTTSNVSFSWSPVSDAVIYNLVVYSAKDEVVNITTSNTFYSTTFNEGFYEWKVRAQDVATNWSDYSLARGFSVILSPAGWAIKESVPTTPGKKGIKDGGALVCHQGVLYALQGGNSVNFFAYENGTWSAKCSIPYALKPNGKPDKKRVKAGGALVAKGCTLYAFKGGNTSEFWAYITNENRWIQRTSIPLGPANSKVKSGGALVVHNGLIYAFKGGNTNEFWMYNPADSSWTQQTSLNTSDGKKIKGGAALVSKGDTIYAFVGNNTKHFYAFANGNWTQKANAMFGTPKTINKGIKDGAALVVLADKIYAFKGGNTQDFGFYDVYTNTWNTAETIPVGPYNKKVKQGGSLAVKGVSIYALKGGNSKEMWCYTPSLEKSEIKNPMSNIQQMENSKFQILHSKSTINVTPNPFSQVTTIHYTVPISSKVSLKLYNANGELIANLLEGYQNAGSHSLKIKTSTLGINSGIYFLKYEDANHQMKTKLIVK
ncbi:MAG: T9SS type A sorting domain-containing protein [candidate division WOR-3 bacterium]|nr:T9SS type A sorting domain-containing protein [candidate division WOR-3 bacterium]